MTTTEHSEVAAPERQARGGSRAPAPGGLRQTFDRLAKAQATPIIAATGLLFTVAAVSVPSSLTAASLVAMIVPAAVMAVAGCGQTLVVQQKGIDLSTGGAITLSAIVLTFFASRTGAPLGLTLLVVLLVSALSGLVNGLAVTKLRITPIIATLATNSLFVGAVWNISGGSTTVPPQDLLDFAAVRIGPVSSVVVVAVVIVAIAALTMSKSALGRRFTAVGANPAAARATGLPVARYIIGSYVASGVFSGLAGILLVSYIGITSTTFGNAYQLPVIAAVIVGGAVLSGGRGSVLATAFGALFLSQTFQMVLSMGAPNSIQLLVQSLALAVAAALRLIPWRSILRSGSRA